MAVRLGDLLLKEKRITPEQLQEALTYQKQKGGKLGFALVSLGYAKEAEITALLSKQFGVPSIAIGQFQIDPAVIKVVASETEVDEALGRYYGKAAVAAAAAADAAASGPSALEAASQALENMPGLDDTSDVEVLSEFEEISVEALAKQGEEAPVIKLVNVILMSAIQKGASDIHIEPYEKELRVRYRIDGLLYNIMQPPMKFRDAITSRIKIMSKLDIAEKRLPQDGRIKIRFQDQGQNRDIDFRVSCLPTLFGEKIVMRLLDKEKLMLDKTKLGFEQES